VVRVHPYPPDLSAIPASFLVIKSHAVYLIEWLTDGSTRLKPVRVNASSLTKRRRENQLSLSLFPCDEGMGEVVTEVLYKRMKYMCMFIGGSFPACEGRERTSCYDMTAG